MNFLHDKHSRYYCIFIVTLVLLLFLMGIAVIDTQTAATKEMFLTHNNAIATSLLEEGISKEVIATALMNTEAGTTGNKFLAEIGLSNSTDIENLPYVSAVKKYNTDISVCDVISMDAASVFRYNAVFVS